MMTPETNAGEIWISAVELTKIEKCSRLISDFFQDQNWNDDPSNKTTFMKYI